MKLTRRTLLGSLAAAAASIPFLPTQSWASRPQKRILPSVPPTPMRASMGARSSIAKFYCVSDGDIWESHIQGIQMLAWQDSNEKDSSMVLEVANPHTGAIRFRCSGEHYGHLYIYATGRVG